MITLPPEFTETKYPGYFWNLNTQTLFSIKPSGILHELKKEDPSKWNEYRDAYRISNDGQKRYLYMDYLKLLKATNSTIPVRK